MARRRPRCPISSAASTKAMRRSGGIKLRFGTLSEFFDRVRAEPDETVPTLRGDWTDWWNFGAGSTAHETGAGAARPARSRRGHGARGLAPGQAAAPPRHAARDGPRAISRSTPSTPGAPTARSASRYSPETRTQQLLKLATAAEGASIARMLRRDGLERSAIDAGGDEPRLLVHNPHPFAVTQSLRLPYLPPLADAPDPKRGFGLEDLVPSGPIIAPHPAPGRRHVRPLRRSRLLDRADRRAGAVLRHHARRRRARRPISASLSAKGGVLSNGRVTSRSIARPAASPRSSSTASSMPAPPPTA